MPEHNCIQQGKITGLCSDASAIKAVQGEHENRLNKMSSEIYDGDRSIKTRIARVEDGFIELEKVIRSTSAMNRWIIGGLVIIQLAATGGLYAMMSKHIEQNVGPFHKTLYVGK